MNNEEVLNIFLLANIPEIITQEEFNDVKNAIKQLQQENQELKKENKILRENAEHNDKVVDKVNWENQKLKKQIEYLQRSIERKEETIIELEHERVPYTNEYVAKLENQQKEFVEWLENEKNIYPYDISDYVYEDIINTILSKYYEIIEK